MVKNESKADRLCGMLQQKFSCHIYNNYYKSQIFLVKVLNDI